LSYIRDNKLYAVGVLNNDFEGGDFKLYNPNEIILDKVIGNHIHYIIMKEITFMKCYLKEKN